jgi:hypothetical protein
MERNGEGNGRRRKRRADERERHGRDCVSEMLLLRTRPDMLANALREMGITEKADNFPSDD